MAKDIIEEIGIDIAAPEVAKSDRSFNYLLDKKYNLEDTSSITKTHITNTKKMLNKYKIKGKLIGDHTPDELKTHGKLFRKMILDDTKLSKSQRMNILKQLNTQFKDAGYHIPDGRVTNIIRDITGEKKFNELTNWDKMRARRGVDIPSNFYKKMPSLLRGLTGEAKNLGSILFFGGYRPNDFAGVKIENINFNDGIIHNVRVKGELKTFVLPDMVKDIVRKQAGNRTSGFLFRINNQGEIMDDIFNPIRKALAAAFPDKLKTYKPHVGKVTDSDAGLKLFRNANESLWNELGPGYEKERLLLTGRASPSVAEEYGLSRSSIQRIRKIASRSILSKSIGYAGVDSVVQMIANIGFDKKIFSNVVKRIAITANLLVDEVYTGLLSTGFMRSLKKGSTGLLDIIPVVDEKLAALVGEVSDADMRNHIATKDLDTITKRKAAAELAKQTENLLAEPKKINLTKRVMDFKKKIDFGNLKGRGKLNIFTAGALGSTLTGGDILFGDMEALAVESPADPVAQKMGPIDYLVPIGLEPSAVASELQEMKFYDPEQYEEIMAGKIQEHEKGLRLEETKEELGIGVFGELDPTSTTTEEDRVAEAMADLGF